MTRHNISTALVSLFLASTLSIAAAMCPASGFNLPLGNPTGLILLCCTVSLAGSILFQLPHGKGIFGIISLLPGILLLCRQIPVKQCVFLIQYLRQIYGAAYQLPGVPLLPSSQSADFPLMLLGYLAAVGVSHWVCQGKGLTAALMFSLFPLLLCLVVTDTLPDTLFLFLILTGCAIIVLTASVRKCSIPQANGLTRSALPVIVAAWILIFALMPQKGYEQPTQLLRQQIFTWTQQIPRQLNAGFTVLSDAVKSGREKTIGLSKLGKQIPSSAPVMTVTTQYSGPLYLRGQDYDHYSGTGWVATGQRTEHFSPVTSGDFTVTIQTRRNADILYIPCYAASDFTLIGGSVPNSENIQQYQIPICLSPDKGFSVTLADLSQYLDLPQATQDAAKAVLADCCQEYGSSNQTVAAISYYVQNSAAYSLEPAVMPREEPDFALWFLTRADSGYCAHFATAAVVLLRAAGIPARYVTGYLTTVRAGFPTTVTRADAHAWAEYYDLDSGLWRILEATPPDPAESTPVEATVSLLSEDVPTPTDSLTDSHDLSLKFTSPALLYFVIVFPAVLTLQRMIRLFLRKRRQSRGSVNAKALARWEAAEQLSRLLKQAPPEETLFLAQKAGFSHHELTTQELEQLDSYLRSCRQQLQRKQWYIRLIHKYIFAAY